MPSSSRHLGFTLVEMLLVISLITIIGSYSVYTGVTELRHAFLSDDEDTVFFALATARTNSLHGICTVATCFDTSTQSTFAQKNGHDVVFDQNGTVQNPFVIKVSNENETYVISATTSSLREEILR